MNKNCYITNAHNLPLFVIYICIDSAIRRICKVDCYANPTDLLAMTKYYKFAFDSHLICKANHNRSNGSVALRCFGAKPTKIELKVHRAVFCRRNNANCIPQNKLLPENLY